MDKTPFKTSIENFFMTDPISRASQTMARCILDRQGKVKVTNPYATDEPAIGAYYMKPQ